MAKRNFREAKPRKNKPAEEKEPVGSAAPKRDGDERQQRAYWCQWKDAAKKAADKHWHRSKEAWNEYLLEEEEIRGAADLTFRYPRKFPIFWSSIQTLQPAYYSRTPVPVVKQTFDSNDPVASTAAILVERLAKFLLTRTPFDEAMEAVRDQFILTSKAAGRVYFEPEIEATQDRIALMPAQDGVTLIDQTGAMAPEGAQILQDQSGYYYERPGERLVSAQVYFCGLEYDEVLHTPYARNWSEVTEIAYRVVMSKEEATAKFGEKAEKINFVDRKSTSKEDRNPNDVNLPDTYVELWEIWDKKFKKVLWLCESYEDGMLLTQEDIYGIDGFFPQTEFIFSTKPAKSLYPTPWFTQVASTLQQLNSCWNRIFRLIGAVRRRGIADGSVEALISAINDATELEVIGVQNFAQIVEKGGIGNLIQYLPIQELVAAIGELKGIIDFFKQQFYEFTSIPDIVRGSSNAMEGVGTQQLKGQFAVLRFSNDQRKMQSAALNGLELMVDLALAKLPVQILRDVSGADFLPQTNLPYVDSAIHLLKQDRKRVVRIDIETDSTSYLNDQINAAQRNETAQTVMNGLQQVGQIAQAQPEFAGVALQTLLFALRGLAQGKSFEGEVAQAVTALVRKVSQPPPAPPDYEGQKLQIQQQELMLKQQAETAKAQLAMLQVQNDQRRLEMEHSLSVLKYQMVDAPKLELDYQKEKNHVQMQMAELQQKLGQALTQNEREQIKLQQKAVQDNFERWAESQRLEFERAFTMLAEREKIIEENRLKNEQVLETMRMQMQAQKPAEPSAPPVVNIIQQPQPNRPTGIALKRLPDGTLSGEYV